MGAKIKKCKKKENRGELNGWTGNRQRNPTSEIQRDMIQQQDRPKELLYVVTPALTASLPCNTMTYNDILYVSLCMYHYVSIYICTIMIHYVPMILYASKRPEMSKPGIPAKLRAKWPGDSWRLNVPEIKKRLIQTLSFFCILQYFSLFCTAVSSLSSYI